MSAADLEKAYGVERAFPDYSRFIDGIKSTDSSELICLAKRVKFFGLEHFPLCKLALVCSL